jgi:hypothetical protein
MMEERSGFFLIFVTHTESDVESVAVGRIWVAEARSAFVEYETSGGLSNLTSANR